jgi:electron transfer flavoprotein beta subunit
LDQFLADRGQRIALWNAEDIGADYDRVGLSGSPTKVLKVDYVMLESADSREITANEEGMSELVRELVEEYIV